MGYCTDYTIDLKMFDLEARAILNEDVPALYCQEIRRQLEELSDYEFEVDRNNPTRFQLYDAKWYEHESHLLQVSKAFPGMLIEVSGEGEASDDNWINFFLNGRGSGGQAEIVFPEFEASEHFDA